MQIYSFLLIRTKKEDLILQMCPNYHNFVKK